MPSGVRRLGQRRQALDNVSQGVVFGNSLLAGGGATSPDRDLMTRFATMIKAKEYNYAKSASVMLWTNGEAITNSEFGVVSNVLQSHKRPVRAASEIASVDPAIGATTVTVTSAS